MAKMAPPSGRDPRDQRSRKPNDQFRVDEQIRVPRVRVIDKDGRNMGEMPLAEALDLARNDDLNLVEVGADSKPPTCKIMDYGKFLYEKRKNTDKKPKTQLKEIHLRPKTGEHDLAIKIAKARELLGKKHKVTIVLTFRGRENVYSKEGMDMMNQLVADLDDVAKVESPPKLFNRRINCTLAPK